MSTQKNFKSPDGTEKYIASTMGWSFRIGSEWVAISEYAWRDCYAAGCVSEDMFNTTVTDEIDKGVLETLKKIKSREDLISHQMREWYENNDVMKFDKAGRPKTLELRTALKMTITRDERDKVWNKLQEELK